MEDFELNGGSRTAAAMASGEALRLISEPLIRRIKMSINLVVPPQVLVAKQWAGPSKVIAESIPMIPMPEVRIPLPVQDYVRDLMSDLAESARRLLGPYLPPNWPADVDLNAAIRIMDSEGLPLVYVPPTEVVSELLAAADRPARVAVLLNCKDALILDCHRALSEVIDAGLQTKVPLAHKAVRAFADGHHEAAQALAVNITETIAREQFGNCAAAEQGARSTDDISLGDLRVRTALAPLPSFYTPWWANSGDPVPDVLSRHVTAHFADTTTYDEARSLIAILLVTSVLSALDDAGDS